MILKTLAVVTGIVVFPVAASATVTAYTSSAAFAAATHGTTAETYGAYAPGTLIADGGTLGALTYTFATASGLGGVITDDYNAFTGNSLAAKQVAGPLSDSDYFYNDESFTVVFPTAVTAAGFFSNTNNPVTLSISGPGTVSNAATVYDTNTFDFLGVTSTAAFTSVTFTSSTYNIPEIEYGTSNAVPEPTAWAMMLMGFGLVGVTARQRRRTLA
jgi:hypothetical protein